MIYIRTDSNEEIAAGHVMRCLSLAQELRRQGEKVLFLSADANPTAIIREDGFEHKVLGSRWDALDEEIEIMKGLLQSSENAFLLIDTYKVTRRYVENLLPCVKIGYLGSKREYLGGLDLLINYSSNIDADFYRKNYGASKTKLLLGTEYAPLRAEFQDAWTPMSRSVRRILLTTGSTDSADVVSRLLPMLLESLELTEVVLDVVIGPMFSQRDELKKKYGTLSRVALHENVRSMSTLMCSADLAISANGTTVYELAAMGLPVISFAMNEEQEPSAEGMARLGIVDFCGNVLKEGTKCLKNIYCRVVYYCGNPDARNCLAKIAHKKIDGKGSQRIAEQIIKMTRSS